MPTKGQSKGKFHLPISVENIPRPARIIRPFQAGFFCAACTKRKAFFLHRYSSLENTPLTQCLHLQDFFLLFPVLSSILLPFKHRIFDKKKQVACRTVRNVGFPNIYRAQGAARCRKASIGNHFPRKSRRTARASGARHSVQLPPLPPTQFVIIPHPSPVPASEHEDGASESPPKKSPFALPQCGSSTTSPIFSKVTRRFEKTTAAHSRARRNTLKWIFCRSNIDTTFLKKYFLSYVVWHFQDVVRLKIIFRNIFWKILLFFWKKVLTRRRTFAIIAIGNPMVV